MANSVTKADLVTAVATSTGMKKVEAERAINALTTAVEDALQEGNKVTLVGFGTFLVGHRDARTGNHPKTREPVEIAESWNVKFRPGKALKDAVNGAHRSRG